MKKIFFYSFFLIFVLFNFSFAKEIKIEVLYFHATIRCHACLTIEEYTDNILKTKYYTEIENGFLTFKSLDFLEEKNEKFQKKYSLETQTLILSKKVDGKEIKWKNLDKIWDFYYDFNKFEKYLTEEINRFINE